MRKYILFGLLVSFLPQLIAQNVEFSASAPKVVEQGERFKITYSVNAEASGFQSPDMKPFSFQGPSVSNSSSIQIINGEMTQSYSYSYVFYLKGFEAGTFTIQPAKVNVKGKTYKSNSLTIEVVEGQSGNNQTGQNNSTVSEASDNLFVRILLSKTQVFQGEPVVATLKLYSRVDLAGFEKMDFPSFSGFWSQDLQSPRQISLERESVNGVIYNVGLIKQNLLFPQRTGKIEIEPFVAEVIVGRRSIFGVQPAGTKRVVSPKVVVNVKSLPANKPESFSGAIGKFSLKANIDKNKVVTNEAINLNVKITGTGNLKLIDNPKIEFPPDFEVYEPKITNSLKNGVNGTSGSKSYEYLIIPRHSGKFKIPPILFSYFDVQTGKYKELSANEFLINVAQGENDGSQSSQTTVRKEDIQIIGQDIRYIKTADSSLKKPGKLFFRSNAYFLMYVIPALLFLIVFIILRKQAKINAD